MAGAGGRGFLSFLGLGGEAKQGDKEKQPGHAQRQDEGDPRWEQAGLLDDEVRCHSAAKRTGHPSCYQPSLPLLIQSIRLRSLSAQPG